MNTIIPHSRVQIPAKSIQKVSEQLKSGQICDGEMTKKLCRKVCDKYNFTYARATSSGTQAIILALLASNIGEGDEVLIQNYICEDILSAVISVGATPIFLDCTLDFEIDISEIYNKLTINTKALIIAGLFGMPLDLKPIRENTDIIIIEDHCHSLGSDVGEYDLGEYSDFSIFSLHALKMVPSGEGGIILTRNSEYIDNLNQFSNPQYSKKQYKFDSHLSDILSSLAIESFQLLGKNVNKRRNIFEYYTESLKSYDLNGIYLPKLKINNRVSSCYRYCLRFEENLDIDFIFEYFFKKNITVRKPIKILNHKLYGCKDNGFQNSITIFKNTISLPIYDNLELKEAERVKDASVRLFDKTL